MSLRAASAKPLKLPLAPVPNRLSVNPRRLLIYWLAVAALLCIGMGVVVLLVELESYSALSLK